MNKIYFILIPFVFFTGCAQNLALLGPAFSVVKTGGIQQALVGETINRGVKSETGKDVTGHVVNFLEQKNKNKDCQNINHKNSQETPVKNSKNFSCKKIQ